MRRARTDKARDTYGVLCSAERRGDGDEAQELPSALLLQEIQDSLRCIDGRSAADGDDDVRARLLEDLHAPVDARDGGVLADLPERARVGVVRLEHVLDLADHVGLFSHK